MLGKQYQLDLNFLTDLRLAKCVTVSEWWLTPHYPHRLPKSRQPQRAPLHCSCLKPAGAGPARPEANFLPGPAGGWGAGRGQAGHPGFADCGGKSVVTNNLARTAGSPVPLPGATGAARSESGGAGSPQLQACDSPPGGWESTSPPVSTQI